MAQFLLTRLLRGATYGIEPQSRQTIISTHTPLARRDVLVVMKQMLLSHFYSHASCEARPSSNGIVYAGSDFYSHASCEARLSGLRYRVVNV